ncbi:MAG TPA: hypothetical protein PK360_01000 [bacterium]|nr:hypothetical protein [bacterium]
MNRRGMRRFVAPAWVVAMLFVVQAGGAEIYQVVFQVHAQSLPGNSHFQWFTQMQKEKAENSTDEKSYAEHSTLAANAAVVAANGFEYDVEHTMVADYSEDRGITRFAIEGVVPMPFIDKDKATVPVEMEYKYCKYVFDGNAEYTFQKDLASDKIDIEYKTIGVTLKDCSAGGAFLLSDYVEKLNQLTGEYLLKTKELSPIRIVEGVFVEYSLNQAYPIITEPFHMQIASDQKWIKLIEGDPEKPELLRYWRFLEPNRFFPADQEVLFRDYHFIFTVKSVSEGDASVLKTPDNVERTSVARKRGEIPF